MTDERPGPGDANDDEKLASLEERLHKLHDSLFDEEDEQKLRDIEERAKAVSQKRAEMPEVPEWDYKRPELPGQHKVDSTSYLGLGVGLSVAYTLVGMALAGWGIGWLIDRNAGTGSTLAQGLGTLVGATFGLAAGIFTIIRAQNRNQNK